MQRLAVGLGLFAALLLVMNIWLLRSNARLETKVEMMSAELARSEARSGRIPRVVAAPARPGPGAVRAKSGPDRTPRMVAKRGKMDPERAEEVRQNLRNRALDFMFNVVGKTGDARGWDDATIAEAQRIVEDAFLATGELRAAARDGEMSAEDVMDETERIREQREQDLFDLLGETESMALWRAMHPKKARTP